MTWTHRGLALDASLNSAADYERIEVRPLGGTLGAEVHGVDLSRPLEADTLAEIKHALLDHLVLFFRDQRITPEQHEAFGRHFGDFLGHEFVAGIEGHPEIMRIRKRPDDTFNFGGDWHSDITYAECPPMGSILYAIEVPAFGGDTLFANMYVAYETLSETMKRLLGSLSAVHSARQVYSDSGMYGTADFAKGHTGTAVTTGRNAYAETTHPVVRTHPETGRKSLFVNRPFTTHFEGMTPEESAGLLEYLFEHATRPDFTCRFAWRDGSIAFWDNRCTQHYALNDYPGRSRTMHRLTIAGDRPF